MGVEGLLAEIKLACRTARSPNAEKHAYLGGLCQMMRRHLAAGGRDSRKTTSETMRRAGVPLDVPRSEQFAYRLPVEGLQLGPRRHFAVRGFPGVG
jgi:hypothetical protein